jgi:predicted metal-dependent hydrolase
MSQNELFHKGLQAFNLGQFFEAHEIWEEFWQELRLNRPDSQEFTQMQALIQISVALHLIQENRIIGAKKVLERARINISKANENILGVNIECVYQEIIRFFEKGDFANCLNVKIS